MAHPLPFDYHNPAMMPDARALSARYPVERRRFVAMIVGGLLAAPLAEAQEPQKLHRIGLLSVPPEIQPAGPAWAEGT